MARRLHLAQADAAFAVDVIDHHEAVVDDHAGERHDTEAGEDGDVHAHDDMPPDGADEAERDCRHDNEGLDV